MSKMKGLEDMDRDLLWEEMDILLDEEVEALIEASKSEDEHVEHTELKYQDRNLESCWC